MTQRLAWLPDGPCTIRNQSETITQIQSHIESVPSRWQRIWHCDGTNIAISISISCKCEFSNSTDLGVNLENKIWVSSEQIGSTIARRTPFMDLERVEAGLRMPFLWAFLFWL